MEKIDIKKITEGIDKAEIARVIFPHVKYPVAAFDRVLRGEALLDTEQLERLASYIGVTICDLFSAGDWKGRSEEGVLTFVKGPYKAKLNYKGSFLVIYKDSELVAEQITSANFSITELINVIETLIKNYENGKN